MSEHSSQPITSAPSRSELPDLARQMLKSRWSVYAAIGVIGVLTLAYFDGGEEPIRPIVQQIALPAGTAPAPDGDRQ